MSRLAYPMVLVFLLALGAMLWVEHRGTSQLLAWLETRTAQAQSPRENDPAPPWPADREPAPRVARPLDPPPSWSVSRHREAAAPSNTAAPTAAPGRYIPPAQDPALDDAPLPEGYGPRPAGKYNDAPLPRGLPAPSDFAGTWLGFPLGATLEVEAMPVKAGIVEVQSVNGRRVPVTRIRVSYRQPVEVSRTRPDGSQEQIKIQMERALPTTPRMMLRGVVEDRGVATGGELVLSATDAVALGAAAPIVAGPVIPGASPSPLPPSAGPAGAPAAPAPTVAGYPTTGYPTTGYPTTAHPAAPPPKNPYATPERPDFSAERPDYAAERPVAPAPRDEVAGTATPGEEAPWRRGAPVPAPAYSDTSSTETERGSPVSTAPAPWARGRAEAPPAEVSIGDNSRPSEASVSDVRPVTYTPESRPTIARPQPAPVAEPAAPLRSGVTMVDGHEITETTILAMVNSEAILAGEVLPMIEPRLAAALAKVPPEQMELALKEVTHARKALLQQSIEPLIQRKILYQDAKRTIPAANFPNVQEQLTKEFEKRVEQMMQKKGFDTRRQLEVEAAEQGNSLSQQKKAFIEELLAREFVTRNSSVNEEVRREELLTYYRAHAEEFAQKSRARWEQLMIRFDAFPSKEDARFAIGKLGNRVIDGEDFATVARTGSQGPTAKDGGKRDWTTQGSLVSKVLDEALFKLPVGKLSTILEDDRGYYIIRVTERVEAGRTPFEEVQPEIREKIKKERKAKAQQAYIERLSKSAVVWRLLGEYTPPPMEEPGPSARMK